MATRAAAALCLLSLLAPCAGVARSGAELPNLDVADLEDLVRKHPDDAGYRLLLAGAYESEPASPGRIARSAIPSLERAAASDPGDPYAHLLLGEAYLKLKDPGRAAGELEKGLSMRPSCAKFAHGRFLAALPDGYYWLGEAYLWKAYFSGGDLGKAQEQFMRADAAAGGGECGDDAFTRQTLLPAYRDLSSAGPWLPFGAVCEGAPGKTLRCRDGGFPYSHRFASRKTAYRHFDALVRLAFLCEAQKDRARARSYYERAARLSKSQGLELPWPDPSQAGPARERASDFWVITLLREEGYHEAARARSEELLKRGLGPSASVARLELALALTGAGRPWAEIRPHLDRVLGSQSDWYPGIITPVAGLLSRLMSRVATVDRLDAGAGPGILKDFCGRIGALEAAHPLPQLRGLWNQCSGLMSGAIAHFYYSKDAAKLAYGAELCGSLAAMTGPPDGSLPGLRKQCAAMGARRD